MNRMELVEANVVQCLRRRSVEDGEPALRHEGWSVRVIAGKGRCVGRRSRARGIHDEMGLMKQDGIRNSNWAWEYVPVHNACTGGCFPVQHK
jgi:hypothetical protein